MIMSIQEMHESFLHFYDKQSNFASPEVTAEEIDIYLNYAQEKFLKYLTEKGLEKSEEWADYTKNLLRRAEFVSQIVNPSNYQIAPPGGALNKPFGQFVTFEEVDSATGNVITTYKSRLILLEEALIQFTPATCSGQTQARVPVIPISKDEYSKAVKNPFRKPWKEEIFRLPWYENSTGADKIELIGFQGCTILKYYVDYLEDPLKIQYGSLYAIPDIDQPCLLDYKGAVQIVEMAVNFALQTMNDPRIATKQYDKLIKTI